VPPPDAPGPAQSTKLLCDVEHDGTVIGAGPIIGFLICADCWQAFLTRAEAAV